MSKPDISIYDLTKWKPITHDQYTQSLCECFLTSDEPEKIETKVEVLDDDGRWRIATYALVCRKHGGEVPQHGGKVPPDSVQPYLLVLFEPEGESDQICFRRTDVELAV